MGKNVNIINCSQRRFKVQNDLRDWEIDHTDKPIKVINEKYWEMSGYSIDAKDIPLQKIESIDRVPKKAIPL